MLSRSLLAAALLCVTYETPSSAPTKAPSVHVHTTQQKYDTRPIEDMWLTEQTGICKKSVKPCQKSVGELLAMQGCDSFHESYLGHAGKSFIVSLSLVAVSLLVLVSRPSISLLWMVSPLPVLITTHPGFRVCRRFFHTDCAFI